MLDDTTPPVWFSDFPENLNKQISGFREEQSTARESTDAEINNFMNFVEGQNKAVADLKADIENLAENKLLIDPCEITISGVPKSSADKPLDAYAAVLNVLKLNHPRKCLVDIRPGSPSGPNLVVQSI